MKKILVTVAEFVENGGEMRKGDGRRKLFYENGIEINIQDDDLYNAIIKCHSNAYYVKINYTPIYN